jgi:hypothetical protein
MLSTACGGGSSNEQISYDSSNEQISYDSSSEQISYDSSSEQIGHDNSNDQVVTIYFGGTTMTRHHWKGHPEFVNRPETVATLHHLQKAWQREVDGTTSPPDGKDCSNVDKDNIFCRHHKGMVDGIGRGWQLIDAANPTIFDLTGRGWSDIFNEAKAILEPVAEACPELPCITLNLVGFSRGAVSTMYFVHKILSDPNYYHIKVSIKKTNILAFDPVPGDSLIDERHFNLPPNVEYLGFYSEDERSALFAPVFPARTNPSIAGDPPVTFFTVPGSHETMVGSIRRSGHHWHLLCTPFVFDCNDAVLSLDHVSSALKIVSTEILGSSDWGHVRFRQPDTNDADENQNFAQLDLDWYDTEMEISELQKRFGTKIDNIYGYTDYDYMHDYSFVLALEAWRVGCWTAWNTFVSPLNLLVSSDYPRCVYYRPGGYVGLWPHNLGLSTGPLNLSFAPFLNTKSSGNYEIWNLIKTRGSLDVDGDFVDYSEDNCPTVSNRDQSDFDGDGFGDVCDNDTDNDGVDNRDDVCARTPLGDIVDANNGCSIAQLCPCEGPRETTTPWKNHGKYVSCRAHASEDFVNQGLITDTEKDAIMSEAGSSSCGKKK